MNRVALILLSSCLRVVGIKSKSAWLGGPEVNFPDADAVKAESLKHWTANLLNAQKTLRELDSESRALLGARAKRLYLWRMYRRAEQVNNLPQARELRRQYEKMTQAIYDREREICDGS